MNLHNKGVLITLIGVLIITPDSLLIRLSDSHFWTISFWRGLLSGLAVIAYLGLTNYQKLLDDLRNLNRFDLIAFVCFSLGNTSFVFAINHTWVANVLLLLSTSPVFAAIFAFVFLKKKTDQAILWALLACFVGVSIIVAGGASSEPINGRETLVGDIAALFTAMIFAASITLAAGGKQRNTALSFAFGGFCASGVALFFAPTIAIDSGSWLWILLMGILVIPLSYCLILHGASYIPAAQAALMIQMEAILGPIWVWWAIGELPSEHTWIGGAMVLISLLSLNLYQLRQSNYHS